MGADGQLPGSEAEAVVPLPCKLPCGASDEERAQLAAIMKQQQQSQSNKSRVQQRQKSQTSTAREDQGEGGVQQGQQIRKALSDQSEKEKGKKRDRPAAVEDRPSKIPNICILCPR